jgi:excisionase family DNA binding protein
MAQMKITKELAGMMTTTQAAAVIGTTQATVRVWCNEDRFKGAIKAGRDWLIPKDEVKTFKPRPRGRPRKSGR